MTTENAKTPAPPPPPSGGDARLDSFLQKAAPIIAVERGINARSRVLLEALARDVKLPEEFFDQAIHMLQGAPPVANKEKTRWERAFRNYVRQKVKNAPQGILTVAMETRATDKGVRKYMLGEEQARDAVREVAEELGVRRISLSEAERYVAEMIEKKVADAEWLDDKSVTRLRAAGVGWGLSVEQVDALIRECTSTNRERQEKEQKQSIVLLTAAGIIIVAMICVFVGLALFNTGRRSGTGTEVVTEDPADDPENPVRNAIVPVEKPEWWSTQLIMNTARLRARVPSFHSTYEKMASTLAADRSEGYDEVIQICRTDWSEIRPLGHNAVGILSECYALEPDDEAADHLREITMALMQVEEGKLPRDESDLQRAFWAVSAIVTALKNEKTPAERADEMELGLGRAIGVAVNRHLDEEKLVQYCSKSLTKLYYQRLTAAAPDSPNTVATVHAKLSVHALDHDYLDRDLHDQLDAEFLGAILPMPGVNWTRYALPGGTGLIDLIVQSKNPVNVLRMVEAFSKTEDSHLKEYIAKHLVRLDGVNPSLQFDHEALEKDVRRVLGVTVPATVASAEDRWDTLKKNAQVALSRNPNTTRDHERLLRETKELAYLATLACALAQQEPGFPVYDALSNEDADGLKPAEDKPDDPFIDAGADRKSEPRDEELVPRPTAAQLEKISRYIQNLSRYSEYSIPLRLTHYRGLSDLTPKVFDSQVSPAQGAVIAKYILVQEKIKTDPLTGEKTNEKQRVLERVGSFRRWSAVKLGLADQIRSFPDDEDGNLRRYVGEILSKILDGDAGLAGETRWREVAYVKLLKSAIDNARTQRNVIAANNPEGKYIKASERLHDMYKTRAQLLGVQRTVAESTASAADVLRLLVDQASSKLAGGGSPGERAFLAGLPYQLTAADYLSTNELKRIVSLQQIYARLLVMEISRRFPDKKSRASQIIADSPLAKSAVSRPEEPILVRQLQNGERTALELWMLFGPS